MGGVWEVCQPRSVRVCLIYVFVEGLVERLRLGQLVHLAGYFTPSDGIPHPVGRYTRNASSVFNPVQIKG